MHSSRKRASVAAAIVVIVVLALGVTHTLRKRANAEAATTTSLANESVIEFTHADLAAVTRHTLSETLPLTGSLRAVTQAAVKAKVAGSALDVRSREGDTVKAGQILATIDARDYSARADSLADKWPRWPVNWISRNKRSKTIACWSKKASSRRTPSIPPKASTPSPPRIWLRRGRRCRRRIFRSRTPSCARRSAARSRRAIVEPGEHVAVDSKLFDVVDLSQLELEAPVPVGEIGRVRVGQTVTFVSMASIPPSMQPSRASIPPRLRARARSWCISRWPILARPCVSGCSAQAA